MQGVYAYALIDNLITEKEIADLYNEEYLKEVLVLKDEILKSM